MSVPVLSVITVFMDNWHNPNWPQFLDLPCWGNSSHQSPSQNCGESQIGFWLQRGLANIKGEGGRNGQKLTLGPGLASTVEVVPVVDVSLTMLDGLGFLSCFDICRFGLWGDRGESSE